MKKDLYFKKVWPIGLCMALGSGSVWAGIEIGDSNNGYGKLQLGGAIRGKYVYDNINEPSTSKLTFSDIIVKLRYDSPIIFGQLDYRFYEYYGQLGDASWLTDAWLGAKIGDEHKVIVGLNPVPFGLGRYWGNTFYSGVGNVIGLEDVHNLGVHYNFKNSSNSVDLSYYPKDGGTYQGKSKDSDRFSINMVEADPYVPNGTNAEEKNIVNIRYNYLLRDDSTKQIGASYWHSDIQNNTYNTTGSRQAIAIHGEFEIDKFQSKVLYGYQKIDTKDPSNDSHVTVGGFDGSFNMANEGNFYSVDLSYPLDFKTVNFTSIMPYLNFSGYYNKNDNYSGTHRIIPGVAFNFKDITIQAEYLLGKNDPYIGDSDGLAGEGNNKWNKKLYVSLAYYF